MNINITIAENLPDHICTGMTCFEADPFILEAIRHLPSLKGFITIDGNKIAFSYSTLGNDGDIFSNRDDYRLIIKRLIPLYAYSCRNGLAYI